MHVIKIKYQSLINLEISGLTDGVEGVRTAPPGRLNIKKWTPC